MSYRLPLAIGAIACAISITTFSIAGPEKQPAAAPADEPATVVATAEFVALRATAPASRAKVVETTPNVDATHMPPRRVPIELANSY